MALCFVLFFCILYTSVVPGCLPSFTTFQPVDLTWMKPQVNVSSNFDDLNLIHILLMEEILQQLIGSLVYPVIYMFFLHPGPRWLAGFL